MYKIITLMLFSLISLNTFAQCNKSNVYESIDCYEKELKTNKTLLNQSYQKLYLSLDTEGKHALENSQKAWLNYKNTHCDEIVAYFASQAQGAGSKLITLSCNAELIQARIKALKDLQ